MVATRLTVMQRITVMRIHAQLCTTNCARYENSSSFDTILLPKCLSYDIDLDYNCIQRKNRKSRSLYWEYFRNFNVACSPIRSSWESIILRTGWSNRRDTFASELSPIDLERIRLMTSARFSFLLRQTVNAHAYFHAGREEGKENAWSASFVARIDGT